MFTGLATRFVAKIEASQQRTGVLTGLVQTIETNQIPAQLPGSGEGCTLCAPVLNC